MGTTSKLHRINVGCGSSPTDGWRNYDNSLSIRLARVPLLTEILRMFRLLSRAQFEYAKFARKNEVFHADVTRRIPLGDGSCDAVYTSHMFHHLNERERRGFLSEALRVLAPGGIIRISVPDLDRWFEAYGKTGDSDAFLSGIGAFSHSDSWSARLRVLFLGFRGRQWMYNGKTLATVLEKCGFVDPVVVPEGETRIPDPEPLDLRERGRNSLFVEARKPA